MSAYMNPIRRVLPGLLGALMLLAGMAHAGSVTYVYTDPQGTPLAEADASGNITATYDYAPYGSQALGTPPNGPGYTGHVNDPDTGLVYMQARYYDPAVGRFISTDPVGPSVGNPFNFNRFAYANNNPIDNMDPDGRCTGSHISNGDGTCVSSGDFTTMASSAHTVTGLRSEPVKPRSDGSEGRSGNSGSSRGGCCGGTEGDEDQGKEQAKNASLAMISEAKLLSEAGYLGKFKAIDVAAVLDVLDEAGSKADLAVTISSLAGGFVKADLANADADIRAYKVNLDSMGTGRTDIGYYGTVQWGLHYDWSKFDPGLDNAPSQILHNLFWATSQLPENKQ